MFGLISTGADAAGGDDRLNNMYATGPIKTRTASDGQNCARLAAPVFVGGIRGSGIEQPRASEYSARALVPRPIGYSARSAVPGSMRAARAAGTIISLHSGTEGAAYGAGAGA